MNDNNTNVDATVEGAEDQKPKTPSKEEFDKLNQDFTSVVEELKELRNAKAIAEGERDALKAKVETKEETSQPKPSEDTMEAAVSTVLAQLEKKNAEQARQSVEADFKASHSEFSEGNDPAGLKYRAFSQVLNRFNLSSLTTKEDVRQAYQDAYKLYGGTSAPQAQTQNPYAYDSQGRQTSSPDARGGDDDLSSQESELLKQVGWTKERYLKLKQSRPAYVQALLETSTR